MSAHGGVGSKRASAGADGTGEEISTGVSPARKEARPSSTPQRPTAPLPYLRGMSVERFIFLYRVSISQAPETRARRRRGYTSDVYLEARSRRGGRVIERKSATSSCCRQKQTMLCRVPPADPSPRLFVPPFGLSKYTGESFLGSGACGWVFGMRPFFSPPQQLQRGCDVHSHQVSTACNLLG
jgi:hypothetical protein